MTKEDIRMMLDLTKILSGCAMSAPDRMDLRDLQEQLREMEAKQEDGSITCQCLLDWTDGTGICETCGKVRK